MGPYRRVKYNEIKYNIPVKRNVPKNMLDGELYDFKTSRICISLFGEFHIEEYKKLVMNHSKMIFDLKNKRMELIKKYNEEGKAFREDKESDPELTKLKDAIKKNIVRIRAERPFYEHATGKVDVNFSNIERET